MFFSHVLLSLLVCSVFFQVQDAQAAMRLYTLEKKQWEDAIKNKSKTVKHEWFYAVFFICSICCFLVRFWANLERATWNQWQLFHKIIIQHSCTTSNVVHECCHTRILLKYPLSGKDVCLMPTTVFQQHL